MTQSRVKDADGFLGFPDMKTKTDVSETLLNIMLALRGVGGQRVWLALGLLILGGLTEGLSILILLPVLQIILKDGDDGRVLELGNYAPGGIPLPDVSISLSVLLTVFVVLVAVQVAFNRAKATYLNDVLFDFTNSVRLSLFAALARARWDRLTQLAASDVEHALTSEVERISTCGYLILSIMQALIMLTIYAVLSLWISPVMTGVVLVMGSVAYLLMRPYRRLATRYGEQIQNARRRQYATVSDFMVGLKIARATNSEARFQTIFADLLDRTKKETRQFVYHNATGSGLFHIFVTLGAAIFIFVAVEIMEMGFASLVVMLLVAMRMAPRFMSLQMQVQQLLPDMVAWKHVRALEEDLVAARDPSADKADAVPALCKGIRFENVTYSYPVSESSAVDNISLEIKAGQVTAFIGASGSGKSTVADLLTGLIQPQRGTIFFDGRKLSHPELRGWRNQISYVSQDISLINQTIRASLCTMVSGHTPTDEDLWASLVDAAADGFVRNLPEGIDTMIGERGVQLSGGQRQRIALAQAFIRKPRFLVLDEATSALDWQALERVSTSVKRMARDGMTVISIAHRPSMVTFTDQVFALEAGRIVEAGTPKDLAKDRGSRFNMMLRNEQADEIPNR